MLPSSSHTFHQNWISPLKIEDPCSLGDAGGLPSESSSPVAVPAQLRVPTDGSEGGKGGKGGDEPTPFTGSTPSNADFLAAIFTDLPDGARILVTGKMGNPEDGVWNASDAKDIGEVCPSDRNTYFNCSSVKPSDGKLFARKEFAAAYHAFVADDVGTKVDRSLFDAISPTWELETSPGNWQIGFKLDPPLTDPQEIDRFQKKIKGAGLTDAGAMGMMRWVRLPNGINGKPKYRIDGEPFCCRLTAYNPDNAYSSAQLLDVLVPKAAVSPASKGADKAKRLAERTAATNVFTPVADEHPVLTALKEKGLYKREISPGRHEMTCPWLTEHTDGLDSGAAYFEPNKQFPVGGFVCQHSHKDQYRLAQLLDYLGLSFQRARNRPLIRIVEGQMDSVLAASEALLAEEDDYYQSGGVIVTVKRDDQTGDASLSPVSEAAMTRKLSQISDWERWNEKYGAWVPSDPPTRHINLLNKLDFYDHLPSLQGLARQPYHRENDGQLVLAAGYDPVSQRLGVFDPEKYAMPAPTRDAAEKALALLLGLIEEFHFAEEIDRSAALSAIFTAVTRPSLGLAPAFHVSAPSSGSGKSYLCETIALFATPGKPAKTSYPKTSEEATKAMLSLLLVGPAVVEFDDMDTDWIPFGPINRMLTAGSITDRILGVSKVATVGTSVLFLGSGNNVGPIRDLVRRVLVINLNARTESPATLTYRGNPVAAVRAERERYVGAVITIIEAWKAAGSPKTPVPSIASYGGLWSDYCRQPLLWLGQPDPAAGLIEQILHDPEADMLRDLLSAWYKEFKDKVLQVRQITRDRYQGELWDCLMELPIVENGTINNSKLGWYLKRNANRICGGYKVEKAPNSERNAWRVVRVAPPSPPLPPSSQPPGEDGPVTSPTAP